MSYRYVAKIGGRTITSNAPFTVKLDREINPGKKTIHLEQEAKKVYYRTECDSPKRQKLSSYDNEYISDKKGALQEQIPNKNFQFSKFFNNCDLRGSNLYFNYK